MMAQKFDGALIDAVEIDPLSSRQAMKNFQASPWGDRITIYTDSIQNFNTITKDKYDLIICNPPYFENHLKSRDPRKNLSRHNDRLSFNELAFIIRNLLSTQGWFYVILPPYVFERIYREMKLSHCGLYDTLKIYSRHRKPVSRIIGGFSRIKADRQENALHIYDEKGNYTEAFRSLLKDFYLAF
jgi:tRNA1Val (adenine37-N6)-methyltransferase